MQPCSLRYGLWLSRIRCLNIIRYLSGEIMWPSKSKTRKILHAFYNVYLVGDQIWIMPLAEVGSRELPYLATTSSAQTTRHASGDSAEPQARGPAPPTMWRISSDLTGTYATRCTFGGSSSSCAWRLARQGTQRAFGGSSASHTRGWAQKITQRITMRKLKRFSRDKICFER
jgi:hypothetical protein